MTGLAVAVVSDAYSTTEERKRFLAAIDVADAPQCEDILVYADVALVGLDPTSVYFGGEEFLAECMSRASARLAEFALALGAA